MELQFYTNLQYDEYEVEQRNQVPMTFPLQPIYTIRLCHFLANSERHLLAAILFLRSLLFLISSPNHSHNTARETFHIQSTEYP